MLSFCVAVSKVYSLLAQLVEHLTVNQVVAGSSPAQGAKHGTAFVIRKRLSRPRVEWVEPNTYREVAEWSKALPC